MQGTMQNIPPCNSRGGLKGGAHKVFIPDTAYSGYTHTIFYSASIICCALVLMKA